jgi:hypothetical protein
MQDYGNREPVRSGRGGRITQSFFVLLGVIAIAGAIGIFISFGQRPAAPETPQTHPAPVPAPPNPQTLPPTLLSNQPASGAGFSIAGDLAAHDVVLFGGVGDYPNTWLWNGSSWTLAHPAASPAGRFGASSAYDPQTKSVVLFGGRLEDGTPIHDTWSWDGTTWVDLDSGAGGPPPGLGSDMAWDPATEQMVLVTSSGVISDPAETWIWAGTHWTHPSGAVLPAGADYSPMSFDPVSKSLLAVGCCVGPPPSTGAANTTWRWSGTAWILLPTPTVAPVNGSTMNLDPATNRLVLCACASTLPQPEFWAWNGKGWAAFATAPLPVASGMEVTDGDELLTFGTSKAEAQAGEPPVDVWVLTSRSTWSQLNPTT